MPIEIRHAVTEPELEAIFRLRYRIYIEEIGFRYPHADHSGRRLPDMVRRASRTFFAATEGEVVGTAKCDWGGEVQFTPDEYQAYELTRFIPLVGPEGIGIFSRFMALPSHRSGEVPTRLFDAVFDYLRACRAQLMFLDCRPHLINTYERLGFRTYTKTYSDPVGGLLVPMVLLMEDVGHLRRVGCRWADRPLPEGLDPQRVQRMLAHLPHESPVHTLGHGEDATTGHDSGLFANTSGPRSVFHDFTSDDIKRLTDLSHVIDCQPGDKVVAENVSDQTVFIVLQGFAEVRRDGRILAVLGAGDVFGEIAFLLQARRTADVFAVGESVRILALRQKSLSQLIESESRLAARFLLNLSRILAAKLASNR